MCKRKMKEHRERKRRKKISKCCRICALLIFRWVRAAIYNENQTKDIWTNGIHSYQNAKHLLTVYNWCAIVEKQTVCILYCNPCAIYLLKIRNIMTFKVSVPFQIQFQLAIFTHTHSSFIRTNASNAHDVIILASCKINFCQKVIATVAIENLAHFLCIF